MAKTVNDYLALAAASRAAAAGERLENVRRVHFEAAASWESLAESARYVAQSGAQSTAPYSDDDAAMSRQCEFSQRAEPLVAPASRDRAASIGDALISDGTSTEEHSPAAETLPQPDDTAIILYSADGNLRTLDEIEADVIRLAIDVYRGRMAEVARRLGIGRSTLYRKLNDIGIDSGGKPDNSLRM